MLNQIFRIVAILGCVLFQSCNNNPIFEPDLPVEINKTFPIIKNITYKENPIVSNHNYPNRAAIITSPEDLSILPHKYIIENPELQDIDFNKYSIVVASIIADEKIVNYFPSMSYHLDKETYLISIVLQTSSSVSCPAEWVFVFKFLKLNVADYNYIVSYSIDKLSSE